VGGIVLSVPLLLTLVIGVALVAVLAATATRSERLIGTVAAARRHGTATGGLAVALGIAVAWVAPQTARRLDAASGVGLLAVPLIFALAHTAVVLAGELTWPRPRGAVRSAALAARAPSTVAPRGLRRLWRTSAALVAVVCAVGWLTADPSGRAIGSTVVGPDGQPVWGGSAGPYPGWVFAAPALVGLLALVVAVEGGLRLVAARAAVAGADPAAEAALRRASAHRLLRGASSGALGTAGGLLVFGGGAVRGVYSGSWGGVVGQEQLWGHEPALVAVGTGATVLGLACGLAALAVLCLPAPRVHPDPAAAPREPVAAA